jgi:hypothetical protein
VIKLDIKEQTLKGWIIELNSIKKTLSNVFDDSTLGDVPILQERLEKITKKIEEHLLKF